MTRTIFIILPVHSGCCVTKFMHSVHACIIQTSFRVLCYNYRQGYKRPTILWPACQNGQSIKQLTLRYYMFLAGSCTNYLWHNPGNILQCKQGFNFIHKIFRRLHRNERINLFTNLIKRIALQRHLHALVTAKCIDKYRIL